MIGQYLIYGIAIGACLMLVIQGQAEVVRAEAARECHDDE